MKQVKVCLGRFQPFTLGHLKMATFKDLQGPKDIQGFRGMVKQSELLREQPDLKEIAKQKTVIFSIYTPKEKVDKKHPFDVDLMKQELEIVKKAYPEIENVFYTDSADICKWGEMLKKAGYQASVWLTGSDEAKSYVEMAMKVPDYEVKNRDNRDVDGAYTKSFYVESIERSESSDFVSSISGTKVRQALLDDDKELFKKMMPKGVDHLFNEFKEAVENAPEEKKKTKKIKEYLSINMKSLLNYINESSSDFLLLKTYEQAEQYFTQFPKTLERSGLSFNDIKVLYDIAAKNNKTAPIVGQYKNKSVFAMRRWVDSKIEEWSEESKNKNITTEWFWTKIKGVYAGPHNTNLKEDGAYSPSAEDMESVVAFAVNKKLNPEYNDIENIKYCCNDTSSKESQKQENMLNYYQDEFTFINNCADVLIHVNEKIHKLSTSDKVNNDWIVNGSYKDTGDKPNATPKTDLISESGKYKISLKKAGGSQPMSGTFNESKATILLAAQDAKLSKSEYDELCEILEKPWGKLRGNMKGISKVKSTGTDDEKKQIADLELNVKNVTKYLNDKLSENKDFMKCLLMEAMTGNHKFGKNSNSAANCVFVWSEKKSENKFYPDIESYINHILNNKFRVEISWKTGGSTSYQTLRIITK